MVGSVGALSGVCRVSFDDRAVHALHQFFYKVRVQVVRIAGLAGGEFNCYLFALSLAAHGVV